MNSIFRDISIIVLSIALIVIAYIGFMRVDVYLRLKAVDDCGKVARFEKENIEDKTKVVYPLEDIYKTCLKDKGINVSR